MQGVPPPPPDVGEIGAILDWLLTLHSIFPEAADLATRTEGVSLDRHSLVLRIARGGFGQKNPEATASLLVYLGSMTREQDKSMWCAEEDLLNDLLRQELPQDAKTDFRDLMAELGLT